MAHEPAHRSAISAQSPADTGGAAPAGDLEDFFENGAVGLHLVGRDGTILRANRAELEMLGYAQEAYVGRNIREFHADEPVIADILARLGCGEKLDKYPARLKAEDGSLRHVLITSSALFQDGRFINTRCFTIDVTEKQRADDALRQSHELLEAVVEANPECVMILAPDGRVLRINSAGQRLVGQDRAADAALCVFALVAPEDRVHWRAQHERICRGERLHWEFDLIGAAGRRRRMETHGAPLPLPSGELAHLAVARDITERTQQEQRLRDSERRLRELLEALPAAIYTTDAEGYITFYNEAAVQLAGRRPELGAQWCVTWKLYLPDGTPLPHDQSPMAVALKEQRAVRGAEAIAERPDGSRVPFIPYPTPLRDAGGRVVGAINMLVDITDRKAAETRLQESQARLENVLRTAQVGLWDADLKTGELTVSATCKANFGLPPEAPFTHETMFAAMHPEDRPRFEEARRRAFAGEAPYEIEYRNTWPDGSQHWIFSRASILRDAKGEPARLSGVSMDVSGRRQAEAALRQSEERLGGLLHLAPLAIVEIAADGSIVYANDAAERMLRLRREGEGAPYARPAWRMTRPDGTRIPRREQPAVRALHGEAVTGCEVALNHPDGRRVVISVNAMPLRDADGSVAAALGALTDVTARHQAELALRESEERFRTLANNIPQLAWMADAGGAAFWYNQRWYDYTGTGPEAMEQWGGGSVVDPDMREEVRKRWRTSIATGAAFDMVFSLKGADGVYRPFLTRGAPVRDDTGVVVRWFGTNTDISEQRTIEDALRTSEERLQRLTETLEQRVQHEVAAREQVQTELFQAQKLEAIGQLTGGTAHDFNNLLAAILGNLELLVTEPLTPRANRLVDAAIGAAEKGGLLTNQLLAYARRQNLTPQPVDVRHVVLGLEEMLTRTLGGLIEVSTQLPETLWHVATDPTQLELAILNLAINARDAMPSGGTLRIEAENSSLRRDEVPDLAAGDYVAIAVRDTGAGMAPPVLAKATDPFFTTKEVGKGSGLGLSQVYGFVKQCSGALRIESEVGRGTQVLIWLPRTEATEAAGAALGPDRRSLRHGKVLVVDDDAAVRAVTADLLREAGYEAEEADGAQAALDVLDRDRTIELALVDYAMPHVSGTQFVQEARRRRPRLAVIYVTGYAAAEMLGTENCSVLKKPYRRSELLDRVAQAWPAASGFGHPPSNVVAIRKTGGGPAGWR